MKEKYDPVSLIVLAYNEANTIEKEILLLKEKIIDKLPGSEFIVAEEGSTDGTTEILKRLETEIGIIHLTGKERKGFTKALINAVLFAKKSYVFYSDTGMKHDPDDFWKLYPLRTKYDLIIGRKTNRKDQWYRKIFTKVYNWLIRNYFNIKEIYDCDSGFRLFNQKIVENIFMNDKLFFKELPFSEIAIRTILSGFKYYEVPVSYTLREGPSRSLPWNKIFKVIIHALLNLKKLKKELLKNKNLDND